MAIENRDIRQAFADARRQQDFDDLQNELSGLDTGKARRFLTAEQHDARKDGGTRRKEAQEALSRLQRRLVASASYAALYQATLDQLEQAERATETALANTATVLANARQHHQAILDRAARLPDGTHVFKTSSGDFRTVDNRMVDAEAADTIHWRGGEPSFEDYTEARAAMIAAKTAQSELETYQVDTLGRIRDRMSDETNPVTEAEMEVFQKQLDEGMQKYQAVSATSPSSSGDPGLSASTIAIPNLS